tara:strand:- start:7237 stop:7461 length:225 start_codon:yes stop_codon:yes gene_type:complete
MAITPLSASSEAPDGTQRRLRGQATPTYNSPPSSVFPTSKLEPAANQGEVKKNPAKYYLGTSRITQANFAMVRH